MSHGGERGFAGGNNELVWGKIHELRGENINASGSSRLIRNGLRQEYKHTKINLQAVSDLRG